MFNKQLLLDFLLRVVFFCVRRCFHTLQFLLHRINGVSTHRNLVNRGLTSGNEAEIRSIVWRNPSPMLFGLHDESHFMTWHTRFVPLEYLLKPQVTLYMVDADTAFFVETPEDLDIYNTRKHPFFFKAQQNYSANLIVIPLQKMMELAEKIGRPKCNLSFLLHSTRCGSTAIAQALHSVDDWLCIAEFSYPHKHLYDMVTKHNKSVSQYLTSERFYDITEASVRILTKDFPVGLNVLMKEIGLLDFGLIPFISNRLPSSKIITVHRSGLGTAKSSYQVFYDVTFYMTMPSIWNKLTHFLFRDEVFRCYFMVTNGMMDEFVGGINDSGCDDILYLHFMRWVTHTIQYLKYYKLADHLHCVNYAGLQMDNEATISELFDFLDIPVEQMRHAMEALKQDSQANSSISKEAARNRPVWTYNKKTADKLQQVLDANNLPKLNQEFRYCSRKGIRLSD